MPDNLHAVWSRVFNKTLYITDTGGRNIFLPCKEIRKVTWTTTENQKYCVLAENSPIINMCAYRWRNRFQICDSTSSDYEPPASPQEYTLELGIEPPTEKQLGTAAFDDIGTCESKTMGSNVTRQGVVSCVPQQRNIRKYYGTWYPRRVTALTKFVAA